jgi:uncharacterized cupredoxin-like copper-binding protein
MGIRRLVTALALCAVVIGVGASSVLGAQDRAQKTVVKVTAKEFKFTLVPKTAKAGVVSFVITNKGALPHDFKIAGKKTPLISKGKTRTLTVTLKKGKYPYMCTVPGHAAAGMKGTFVVK